MFTSVVCWQVSVSTHVSKLTIRRRRAILPTVRPLSFRTTCPIGQYQAHSVLRYVQGLGLNPEFNFRTGSDWPWFVSPRVGSY